MVILKVSYPLIWQLLSDCLESHEYKQQIRKCSKTEKYHEVNDEVREFFLISLRETVQFSFLHGKTKSFSCDLVTLVWALTGLEGASRRHTHVPEGFETDFMQYTSTNIWEVPGKLK